MAGMWGGRFAQEQDKLFMDFNASFPFDQKLVFYDIAGSLAYGKALHEAGVLSRDDFSSIESGLKSLREKLESSPDHLLVALSEGHEDVHGYVESELMALIGDAAKRLHTGRSRNDQVATDFRLYARDAIDEIVQTIEFLQKTFLQRAENEQDVILPGFTHLQKAQAISWSHFLLSYFEMFQRDKERLLDARKRVNILPLGSGALAGNNYPIDRLAIAKSLGFDGITANSLDATSDRDFVVEILAALSLTMTHLSRFAEDMIIYCSSEYGYVEMSDLVSTGSSLMPQKKNPDALELIRGKTGRVYGHLMSILTILKGLPSCYNKDLQEDKEGLFDAVDTLLGSLKVTQLVIESLRINPKKMKTACKTGYLNATDLADYLVALGKPFREAHHVVGEVVLYGLKNGKGIEDLTLEELQEFEPQIDNSVYKALDLNTMVSAKDVPGGTNPVRVQQAIKCAWGKLS